MVSGPRGDLSAGGLLAEMGPGAGAQETVISGTHES